MDNRTKYQRWYEALCAKAQGREIPKCYTEVHHIQPRSLGGSDDPSNLVRLTYREHYTAHHLLVRFQTGRNLQKMQRALQAMTMNVSGDRKPTGWQVERAKRAIRDMELENDDAAYLERWRRKKREKIAAHNAAILEQERRREEESLKGGLKSAQDWPEKYVDEFIAHIQTKSGAVARECLEKLLAMKAQRFSAS